MTPKEKQRISPSKDNKLLTHPYKKIQTLSLIDIEKKIPMSVLMSETDVSFSWAIEEEARHGVAGMICYVALHLLAIYK